LLELVLELPLRLRLADAGAPQLVDDEQQDQDADGDARPPHAAQDPRQLHRPRVSTHPGDLERGPPGRGTLTLEAARAGH
jgi:hypothetical protein